MMKKIKINTLFCFLFLIISACDFPKNGINVEIRNLSDKTVEDIKVYTSDNRATLKFEEIKPGESVEKLLNMNNTANSDGSYVLELRRQNGTLAKSGGGYYTNGGALDRKIIFLIKNDTVLVDFPLF